MGLCYHFYPAWFCYDIFGAQPLIHRDFLCYPFLLGPGPLNTICERGGVGYQLSSTLSYGVGHQILTSDTILPCVYATSNQFSSTTPGGLCSTGLSATKVVGDAFSPFFYGLGIPLLSSSQYPASWKLVQDPSGEPGKPRCGH